MGSLSHVWVPEATPTKSFFQDSHKLVGELSQCFLFLALNQLESTFPRRYWEYHDIPIQAPSQFPTVWMTAQLRYQWWFGEGRVWSTQLGSPAQGPWQSEDVSWWYTGDIVDIKPSSIIKIFHKSSSTYHVWIVMNMSGIFSWNIGEEIIGYYPLVPSNIAILNPI